MKIVFFTRLFYPHIGGVEKHVFELSRSLIKKGHQITIITEELKTSDKQKLPSKLERELKNFTIYNIPVGKDNWFKKFRIWRWLWNNSKLFLSSDVIHCHDVFFWYLPLAIVYPMKNVYTTFHGYESYPIKLKAVIYRKISECISNRTICVGDFMKKWYHANPTKIIYGGVKLSKKEVNLKRHSAIFIGRLDEHTGIETYIESTKLIRRRVPDFTLTIYGDGPLKKRIDAEGIIFKGFHPYAEKEIQKYEFAFVSRYLAILEAMAAKRLVIAVYDNLVKEDYLKMTPFKDFIFTLESPEELADKVLYSLNNPEQTEQKIHAGYTWVRKQTWEDLTVVYNSLWGRAKE